MSPMKNIHEAVRTSEGYLGTTCSGGLGQPKRAENPVMIGYDPKLDVSPELGLDEETCFQFIIGILRWMAELGMQ